MSKAKRSFAFISGSASLSNSKRAVMEMVGSPAAWHIALRRSTDEAVIAIELNGKYCDCAANFQKIYVQAHKLLEIYGRTK